MKYKRFLGNIFFICFIAIILLFSVRGLPGNPVPSQLGSSYWIANGPFELSNERGRFALTYSLIEDHSFHFQPAIANFAAPDVGYWNHNYVSLFAPSVSFIAIPGYLIGKYFGVSQFGTFLWMAMFALLNVLLIRAIAIRLGAHPLAATIGGLTFLFATPAFAYAVTLYEHHVSTFFILLSLYLLIRFKTLASLFAIWTLYAIAFTVDYPNLFLMLPIALAAFFRSGAIEQVSKKITVSFSFLRFVTVIGVILPLLFFMWFNQASYNNPTKISGTVARILSVKQNGSPVFWGDSPKQKSAPQLTQSSNLPPAGSLFTFFAPRNMLNGLYILLISPDRGMITFTPIIVFGFAAFFFTNKNRRIQQYISVLLGIIGMDLALYSMWGDPYGGWAFGARYLIPAYSILAICLALLLSYLGKKKIFIFFFFLVFSYSVMVNTLGALTSNDNPPKIEAEALANETHHEVSYTYMRNVDILNTNYSRSFIFQTYANDYLSAWEYYGSVVILILIVSTVFITRLHLIITRKNEKGGTYAVEH